MNLGRATIKKLFLILSFIALATIAFSENTYAAEQEAVVISEELTRLNELYKEGIITEEEFSKAKSILLNPDAEIEKKEKKKKKKKKTTAAERKRLKEQQEEELKALKEQLREEKIKEMIEEKRRIIAEREKACEEDPKSKDCIDAKIRISNIYNKVRLKGLEARERDKQERKLKKEALKEEREKTKEEKELEIKASLE